MTNRMTAAQLQEFYKAEGDTRGKHTDREGPIHKAILRLLDLVLPADAVYHHSPNELDMAGEKAARQIAKARDLGTKAGWIDIEIIWQGMFYGVEVKSDSGRLSKEQLSMHSNLISAGARIEIVRSVDDMQEVLKKWDML